MKLNKNNGITTDTSDNKYLLNTVVGKNNPRSPVCEIWLGLDECTGARA